MEVWASLHSGLFPRGPGSSVVGMLSEAARGSCRSCRELEPQLCRALAVTVGPSPSTSVLPCHRLLHGEMGTYLTGWL